MMIGGISPSALLGFALVSTLTIAPALSADNKLQKYQSLCEENVRCSSYASSDGIVFTLRLLTRTQSLTCHNDGSCEYVLPRGQRQRVKNIEARLSAEQ